MLPGLPRDATLLQYRGRKRPPIRPSFAKPPLGGGIGDARRASRGLDAAIPVIAAVVAKRNLLPVVPITVGWSSECTPWAPPEYI